MMDGTGQSGAATVPAFEGELPAVIVRQIADRVYEMWRKELRTGRERAGLAPRGNTEL
jgi:hypothetical protein